MTSVLSPHVSEQDLPRALDAFRGALDPNGILSPGKQGFWPQSMRETRA